MSRAFSLYLDAVRFLAALLVLFYPRTGFTAPVRIIDLGHEAVVIFFVLSGFVVPMSPLPESRISRLHGRAKARIFSAIPAIILTRITRCNRILDQWICLSEGYQAWDLPVVRVITGGLFLNKFGPSVFSYSPMCPTGP
ncbi:MAG: hypothetical protein R3E50_13745 [Halioglobus sp.]